MAIKAVAGQRFSMVTFGMAQVAMDIEPLIAALRCAPAQPGYTHNYPVAVLVAFLVAAVAPWVCRLLATRCNRQLWRWNLGRFAQPTQLATKVALGSALAGTLLHVAIDSIVQADMTPLVPLYAGNPLLHLVSPDALHRACIAAGIAGAAAWFLLLIARNRKPTRQR